MENNFDFQYKEGDFVKQLKLLNENTGWNLFNKAARQGELDLLRYVYNQTGAICQHGIIWATYGNHLHIIKYLVEEHGVNVSVANDTALQYASYKGCLDIVKYLVEHGANIHASDNEALKLATEDGHDEIVDYLIKRGAKYKR